MWVIDAFKIYLTLQEWVSWWSRKLLLVPVATEENCNPVVFNLPIISWSFKERTRNHPCLKSVPACNKQKVLFYQYESACPSVAFHFGGESFIVFRISEDVLNRNPSQHLCNDVIHLTEDDNMINSDKSSLMTGQLPICAWIILKVKSFLEFTVHRGVAPRLGYGESGWELLPDSPQEI